MNLRTGTVDRINDKMDIVYFEKDLGGESTPL